MKTIKNILRSNILWIIIFLLFGNTLLFTAGTFDPAIDSIFNLCATIISGIMVFITNFIIKKK